MTMQGNSCCYKIQNHNFLVILRRNSFFSWLDEIHVPVAFKRSISFSVLLSIVVVWAFCLSLMLLLLLLLLLPFGDDFGADGDGGGGDELVAAKVIM